MNLNKLLRDNRDTPRALKAEAASNSTPTLYVYDAIASNDADAEFGGGVSPQAFVTALNKLDAPEIHIRLNSPGGDAFGGRVMEGAIRAHPSRIIAHIDGYAASAASYVALAADEVEIAPGGFFMVHNAWTIAIGNALDLLDRAALLEKIDATLVQTYAARTGQDAAVIKTLMEAETWIDAATSLELGFADRIAEDGPKDWIAWDLSAYKNAPAAAAPEPAAAAPEPEPAAAAEDLTEHRKRQLELLRLRRIA